MILTNVKNRINKPVELNDIVSINGDKYKVTGQTEKSLRFIHIGENPHAKEKEIWNKNTFAKRFFFDGNMWSFIRRGSVPNFDYI